MCISFTMSVRILQNLTKSIHYFRETLSIGHYENTPIQIYRPFYNQKKETFQIKKNLMFFHIPAQNIDENKSFKYKILPPKMKFFR